MELELKEFEQAQERLKPILHHTELDLSSTFSTMTGGKVYLKCVPFSSCPQSLPASESFPMSQHFA